MLLNYFNPISIKKKYSAYTIGDNILRHQKDFPDLSDVKIAIFGVEEGGNSLENYGCHKAPDFIREFLYELVAHTNLTPFIADLGNLKIQDTFEDTATLLSTIIAELRSKDITSIVLGGGKELGESIYDGFKKESNLDISYIASDVPLLEGQILHNICHTSNHNLFNINVIGHQAHFVPQLALDTLAKLNFEQCRLGKLKTQYEIVEPLLRNTDLLFLDLNALKHSDSPGNHQASPSGMDGDLACKIAWYAGASDQLKNFSIFEANPDMDIRNQTSKVTAQILWYFFDGFDKKSDDHPNKHLEFLKYRCHFEDKMPDVVFYKSKLSGRWWMEVTIMKNQKNQLKLVPCTYEDYLETTKGTFPDLYLRTLQKWH